MPFCSDCKFISVANGLLTWGNERYEFAKCDHPSALEIDTDNEFVSPTSKTVTKQRAYCSIKNDKGTCSDFVQAERTWREWLRKW